MEVKIEFLQLQDLDSFWQVFSEIIKKDFPRYSQAVCDYFLYKAYTKGNFNYWLSSGWKFVFVAKSRENICGFTVIDKPYGGVSFCRWLGVLEDFRNQGIGKKLIETWLKQAKKEGCHKAELAAQTKAKDFYKKCGLDLEGIRKLTYFGIEQFIFGKVLGKPKDEVMTKE